MTQEEQYKQETGKEPKYWFDNDTYYTYTDDFIYWLKRKADLADAEKARREAAERYLKCFIEYHDIDSFKASISPGMMSKYYQETGKEPKGGRREEMRVLSAHIFWDTAKTNSAKVEVPGLGEVNPSNVVPDAVRDQLEKAIILAMHQRLCIACDCGTKKEKEHDDNKTNNKI